MICQAFIRITQLISEHEHYKQLAKVKEQKRINQCNESLRSASKEILELQNAAFKARESLHEPK
jgi:hypothetical protein